MRSAPVVIGGLDFLALTPKDFDLENKTVTINKSYQRLNGQDVITPPKTPKSNRVIKIPDFLAEEIEEYIKGLYGISDKDRLFPFTKGNPVPAEKKTIAKIRELSARKNEEYEELSEIKKREKSLQEKVNNVRSIYENRIDRIQQKNRDQELG